MNPRWWFPARVDIDGLGMRCVSSDLPGRLVDRVPLRRDERRSEPGAPS
jgi:hypothetical protein